MTKNWSELNKALFSSICNVLQIDENEKFTKFVLTLESGKPPVYEIKQFAKAVYNIKREDV